MKAFIQIHPRDQVAVALQPLSFGDECAVNGRRVRLAQDIPMGHKFALESIRQGMPVVKYGCPIGIAKTDIAPGEHVHVHNVRTALTGEQSYIWQPAGQQEQTAAPQTFMGYQRADGRAGVRNEIWILPTVGCVNSVATALEKRAQGLVGGGVEGVYAFCHPYGCSQMGDDQENTRRILAALATHPNCGGVLVLGLGCENSQIADLKPYMGDFDQSRTRFIVCQQAEDELEAGMEALRELAAQAKEDVRIPISTEKLVVGLKCGGSDGLSGITANPVIGAFSDWLIARGGATMLTEVPEMFGAETILMNRCQTEENFEKTVKLINDFKRYYERNGQPVYENPSPGNKEGGITTLEDKALGCTQKSGQSAVRGVLRYGERIGQKGLNLLSAPGNDLVAATALAASGAQIVLFSTGRGTPFGCPVPTVKIASNTPLAQKKKNWIDFDAGLLLQSGTVQDHGERLAGLVLQIASGLQTAGELNGFRDVAIFKSGVTL